MVHTWTLWLFRTVFRMQPRSHQDTSEDVGLQRHLVLPSGMTEQWSNSYTQLDCAYKATMKSIFIPIYMKYFNIP